jgi:hypothetical protein
LRPKAALLFRHQKGYLIDSECILIWIVHDLNGRARHAMAADLIVQECVSLQCIQDTKLDVPDQSLFLTCLGVILIMWLSIRPLLEVVLL